MPWKIEWIFSPLRKQSSCRAPTFSRFDMWPCAWSEPALGQQAC